MQQQGFAGGGMGGPQGNAGMQRGVMGPGPGAGPRPQGGGFGGPGVPMSPQGFAGGRSSRALRAPEPKGAASQVRSSNSRWAGDRSRRSSR